MSSTEVRATLLSLMLEFIREVRTIVGVVRIAALGSLLTDKKYPKDADVLVTITTDVDLERLARLSRRLKGRAQGINSGADIFLANDFGNYIGRICHYRECFPRRDCEARNCGHVAHLNDDLDVVTLSQEVIAHPPLLAYPAITANVTLPRDVQDLLLTPLQNEAKRS